MGKPRPSLRATVPQPVAQHVVIPPLGLEGLLRLPEGARCVVVFAHGSGSSRFSPRNNHVAEALAAAGQGTLLFDLLTDAEANDRANVFAIDLLAQRLLHAVEWLTSDPHARHLPLGIFGASTGAAAALVAAAKSSVVGAVVSRGGRPDMAERVLHLVRAPTLLIVGSLDKEVLTLNLSAYERLSCEKKLAVVPGATHLFEEPGTLDAVVALASAWFHDHLDADAQR